MNYREFKNKFNIELNKQQEQALHEIDRPTLLLAVPGSGKTTTLVCRVGYMIYVENIAPENILVLTFSRAAAADMKNRFISVFGDEYSERLTFRTINSLCYQIISWFYKNSNNKKPEDFTDNFSVIRDIYIDTYQDYPADNDVRNMQLEITRSKNLQLTDEEIKEIQVDEKAFMPLYEEYQQYLSHNNLMDFDDQLIIAYDIISKNPSALEIIQNEYRYILVDEAQDTSKIQHQIIQLLASKNKSIFMVGDEDQSIYGFRAAYPEALLDFEQVYNNALILKLEQNYRSTKEIVKAANRFILHNSKRYKKNMFTKRISGSKIVYHQCISRSDQYAEIIEKILPDCNGKTAVLYRNNDSAIPLIAELIKHQTPYISKGIDTSFFSSRVVRDIKNLLKSALDPYRYKLFLDTYYVFNARIRKKSAYDAVNSIDKKVHASIWAAFDKCNNLSSQTRQDIQIIAREMHNISIENNAKSAIGRLCNAGYNKKNDDRIFLLKALAGNDDTIITFLNKLDCLEKIINKPSNPVNAKCILSTIHASKGLEYDNVVIIDELEPIFPNSSNDIEEERRLFYVAITRARDNLFLITYPKGRQPFIEVLQKGERKETEAKMLIYAITQYKEGKKIQHRSHGYGQILKNDGKLITVKFEKYSITHKFNILTCLKKDIIKIIE